VDRDSASKENDDVQYDPNLLVRLWKAGDILDGGKPQLARNGLSPALVHYTDENAFGVIMPMRGAKSIASKRAPARNNGGVSVAKAA
jgi:hypothetical protein